MKIMIETPTAESSLTSKVVLHKGIVFSPGASSSRSLIQWKLSDSDFDVNYISHAVLL